MGPRREAEEDVGLRDRTDEDGPPRVSTRVPARGRRVRVVTEAGDVVTRTIRRGPQVGALPPLRPPRVTFRGTPDDPYAGLRRHVPRPGELDEFGLDCVDALVAAVNAMLAGLGRPSLSRGEFPTSRDGYERVRRLMRSLSGSVGRAVAATRARVGSEGEP